MNSPTPSTSSHHNESSRALRAQLLSHFQQTQNPDGGWAFHPGGQSRVEPTCWTIRAFSADLQAQSQIARAVEFLRTSRLSGGAWPPAPGMAAGGWMTSLACSVLAQFPGHDSAIASGLQWLCEDYPRDSAPWRKFLKSLSPKRKIVDHNDEFRGWGWTPRTASWVEPTSFALMAFAAVREALSQSNLKISAPLAESMEERRALAVGLLYDRMCAGGGWDAGNPRVYGVDGIPLVLPTCWSLLALRNEPAHPHRELSLQWLQRAYSNIRSAGSLAAAQFTLEHYGISPENFANAAAPTALLGFSADEILEQKTHVIAWVAIALNSERYWPQNHLQAPTMTYNSKA